MAGGVGGGVGAPIPDGFGQAGQAVAAAVLLIVGMVAGGLGEPLADTVGGDRLPDDVRRRVTIDDEATGTLPSITQAEQELTGAV